MDEVQHEPAREGEFGTAGLKTITSVLPPLGAATTSSAANALIAIVAEKAPTSSIAKSLDILCLLQKSGRCTPAVTSAPLATPISASPATNPAANRMPEPPSSRERPTLASDPIRIATLKPNGR